MRLLLTLTLTLVVVTLARGQTDFTRQDGASGKNVVEATLKQIHDSCVFGKDYQFARRLAMALSQDGTNAQVYNSGVNGGIWLINQTMFFASQTDPSLQAFWPRIQAAFNIDWSRVVYSDLRKPLYSAIAGMLTLQRLTGGNLPRSLEKQAEYYQDALLGQPGTAYQFYTMAGQLNQACGTSNLDLAFLVDSSVSVSPDNFQRAKQFASDVTSGFKVDPNNARVAFLTYSSGYKAQFDFQRYTTVDDVKRAIMAVPQTAGQTDTHLALRYATDSLFTAASGSRQSAVRIAVLITDGNSDNRIESQKNARLLKSKGVILFVIGVGSLIDSTELTNLASQPSCTHVQLLQDYDELYSLVNEIKAVSCAAPIPMMFEYFNKDCTQTQTYRVDTVGVTSVIVQPASGSVTVYGSYSDGSISGGSPDFVTTATASRPTVIYIDDKDRALFVVVTSDTGRAGACDSRYTIQAVAANAVRQDTDNVCFSKHAVRTCTALDLLKALYSVTKPNTLGFPSPCGVNQPGYYPHPFFPTRFIYCDGLGGVYLVDCPMGYYYDDSAKGCLKGSPPTTPTTTTTVATTRRVTTPRPIITFQPPLTFRPSATPSTVNTNITFIPYPDCTLENFQKGIHFFGYQPDDTKYIACSEYPGMGVLKNCSEYHKWNQIIGACVYKDIVIDWEKDIYQNTPRPINYQCKTGEGSIFYHAHPTDPTKYIQCDEFGDAFVKSCRKNEIWSQALTTCVPGLAKFVVG